MYELIVVESNSVKVPREVNYYFLCKKFKCLPHSGGLLDQDVGMLEAFSLCMKFESEFQEIKRKKDEKNQGVKDKARKSKG